MGESRFVELMAKSLDRSASKAELDELALFLDQYPQYKKTRQVADNLTGSFGQQGEYQQSQMQQKLDALWVDIKAAEQKPAIRIFNYWQWLGSAAAIILLVLVGFEVYKNYFINRHSRLVAAKIITVPFGKTMQVKLADGTTVKLNAGSKLIYPSIFAARTREVNLEGEGFFEVTKNPQKPFLVHTKTFTIKVLGTIFNVKAYLDDRITETTLLRGKVQIELLADPQKKIYLLPRQKFVIAGKSVSQVRDLAGTEPKNSNYTIVELPKPADDLYPESAWTADKIVFNNQEFGEVAKQLERKYNVVFVFADDELKHEQISGALQNESLKRVLDILQQIVGFKATISGNTVFIEQKSKQKT